MRLLAITDRIFSVGYVDGAVRHHLDVLSVKDTVLFLSHHIGYSGLHGVEIVPDFVHGIGLSSLFHDRFAGHCASGVRSSSCIQVGGVQVIFHVVGCKFHVAVGDSNISVVIYHLPAVAEILYYRVSGCCKGWRVQ